MKLLFCPDCHDVHGLVMHEWRTCLCGSSGGQYNKDGMTATIGGKARVFGVGNPFFESLYVFLEPAGKKRMWKAFYGHESGDCWWGEYEGDVQIFRIEKPTGPRLKVSVEPIENNQMVVYIIDKRLYTVDRKENIGLVTVPQNPQVKLTRWNAKPKKEKKEKITAKEVEDKFNEIMSPKKPEEVKNQ